MARAICTAATTAISLTSNLTKTLIQNLAPANQGIAWLRASVSFQGVTVSDPPVKVDIVKQTDAGTGLASYTEILACGPGVSITPQATIIMNSATSGTEPTTTDIVDVKYVHPQAGYEYVFTEGQDELTYANARYGLRVSTSTGSFTTCTAVASLWWEE